ncbi:uncharacterized protein TNIN_210671 [Trichonephila inaurata madagascariensis]|uniref:Uncharacterized protein n=1 Tax=Trichonephila inaurata madagascariensis TaxID=2747483 RepID=A0A8X7BSQ5_9ARAC|nr:uncharacterized protein TNIN_210671 [Trichonephila inaurata madagascariensis]
MDSVLFGPNLKLPSIDGVKSGCEEELYLLMKEVDYAFERKQHDLVKEVSDLKSLCQSKQDEIEKLKSTLASRTRSSKKNLEEHTKYLINEVAKLKEENAHLKKENSSFHKKVHQRKESENQLESLKRSLNIQQEENILLKDRLTKLSKQHGILQENYQKLLNVMTAEQNIGSSGNKITMEGSSSNFIEALIAEETEKYMKEESEHCELLESKINQEIEELRRTLKDELLKK